MKAFLITVGAVVAGLYVAQWVLPLLPGKKA